MSDDDKPTIALHFEGGPHDGLRLAWPGDGASCPTAFTFEDHHYDRSPEPGMTAREAAQVALEAKYLGARGHRYEVSGMEIDPDGTERWTYGHKGSSPIAHHQDGL